VLEQLLNRVQNLSDHWAVVIGVSVAFFVVQAILSMKLYAQAWDQDRLLRQLRREFNEGESGRPLPLDPVDDFGWLEWVLTAFPSRDEQRPSARFNRETALHELDTRIASDWSYLLLQRMGVMAPLLGVVLTVIGFYWLKIDNAAEQSLQTILVSVTPLISGVGAGAVLALLNQCLLQSVGGRLERVRLSARNWFDAVVWPQAALSSQTDASAAIGAIEKFSSILAGAAERHAASSAQVMASTAALQRAAAKFEQAVESVRDEVQGLPQTLAGIRDATASSAESLQDLIPVGARAVANLDVSVAAFRTTIDREFAEAARLHLHASKTLDAAVEQMHRVLVRNGAADVSATSDLDQPWIADRPR
jgi:hypothetical protein